MGCFFSSMGVSLGIMAPLHARPAAARLTDHERRLTPCDTGALPAVAGQYDRVFRACHEPARPCLRPPGPPGERNLNFAPRFRPFYAQEVAGYERELDKLVLPGEFRALTEHPRLQLQACRGCARADGW